MDPLVDLRPVSDDYATLPVSEAFDWAASAHGLGTGEWYLVAFRSVRRPGADEDRLCHYDEMAHQEAAASAGFVHYFRGPAAPDGSCLSFCLWESRADARTASAKSAHREAVGLLHEMYASYRLEFLRVTRPHRRAALAFAPYDAIPPEAHDLPAPTPGFVPEFLPHALPG
jgi:hypothetical protein